VDLAGSGHGVGEYGVILLSGLSGEEKGMNVLIKRIRV
jgi:hypothetical protein